jgi:cellulose synthase/poly-beta-1,6-N-acetylglucosamine synthase-like glycosyltransferase
MTGLCLAGVTLLGLGVLHLVYTYAAYPWLIRRLPRRPARPDTDRAPRLVSVIIAARIGGNAQAESLGAKVERLLQTIRLPCEVVVSLDGGAGKAVALNRGVAMARGDMLVFTDLRQDVQPGAVEELVRGLAAPDVGAVAGALTLSTADRPEGLYERYWRFERQLRASEAGWDSTVGVSGALYALKRELWQPLPAGLILDDVWVPMHVVKAGQRVAFAPQAVAADRGAGSDAGELARKVRTLTGNYQLLAWMPWLLDPRKNRIWWQFVSHKVMRLLTPLALLACGLGAVLLLPGYLTAAAVAMLALVLLARRSSARGPGVGLAGTVRSAGVLVAALIVAAVNAVRGRWDVWSVGGGVGDSQ